MPYTVALPDGRTVEFPDSVSQEQAAAILREQLGIGQKTGLGAALAKGTESTLSQLRSGIAGLFGSPEEAAQAGVERGKQIGSEYADQVSFEKLKQAYAQGLLPAAGEVARQIPLALAEQLPNLATMAGSARLGAMAGAPFGPYGAVIGGGIGAFTPSFLQQFGGNIERQAQLQEEAKQPVAIDRTKALTAAVPQAALDVASSYIPLGGRLVSKLTGIPEKALIGDVTGKAAKLAEERLLATLGKGTATGVLAEVPTEVTQQILERWQAGLSLTDADALKEYGETAYQTGLLGPLGAVGRLSERAGARSEIAQQQALDKRKLALEQMQLDEQERQKQEAAEAYKQTPEYAQEAQTKYTALKQQMADLNAKAEAKVDPNDTLAVAEQANAKQQLKALKNSEEFKTAEAEFRRVVPLLREQQARAKAEEEQKALAELEPAEAFLRREGYAQAPISPEQSALADLEAFLGRAPTQIKRPTPTRPQDALAYAQQQIALANERELASARNLDERLSIYTDYLMQNSGMAVALARLPKLSIPGLTKAQSADVLDKIKENVDKLTSEEAATRDRELAGLMPERVPSTKQPSWIDAFAEAQRQQQEAREAQQQEVAQRAQEADTARTVSALTSAPQEQREMFPVRGGEVSKTFPKESSPETLQRLVDLALQRDIPDSDRDMLEKISDNIQSFSRNRDALDAASQYIYQRLLLGQPRPAPYTRNVPYEATVGRQPVTWNRKVAEAAYDETRPILDQLRLIEEAQRSETQQRLAPVRRDLTPEEQAAVNQQYAPHEFGYNQQKIGPLTNPNLRLFGSPLQDMEKLTALQPTGEIERGVQPELPGTQERLPAPEDIQAGRATQKKTPLPFVTPSGKPLSEEQQQRIQQLASAEISDAGKGILTASPEEFQTLLAGEDLNAYREAIGLSYETAQRAQKFAQELQPLITQLREKQADFIKKRDALRTTSTERVAEAQKAVIAARTALNDGIADLESFYVTNSQTKGPGGRTKFVNLAEMREAANARLLAAMQEKARINAELVKNQETLKAKLDAFEQGKESIPVDAQGRQILIDKKTGAPKTPPVRYVALAQLSAFQELRKAQLLLQDKLLDIKALEEKITQHVKDNILGKEWEGTGWDTPAFREYTAMREAKKKAQVDAQFAYGLLMSKYRAIPALPKLRDSDFKNFLLTEAKLTDQLAAQVRAINGYRLGLSIAEKRMREAVELARNDPDYAPYIQKLWQDLKIANAKLDLRKKLAEGAEKAQVELEKPILKLGEEARQKEEAAASRLAAAPKREFERRQEEAAKAEIAAQEKAQTASAERRQEEQQRLERAEAPKQVLPNGEVKPIPRTQVSFPQARRTSADVMGLWETLVDPEKTPEERKAASEALDLIISYGSPAERAYFEAVQKATTTSAEMIFDLRQRIRQTEEDLETALNSELLNKKEQSLVSSSRRTDAENAALRKRLEAPRRDNLQAKAEATVASLKARIEREQTRLGKLRKAVKEAIPTAQERQATAATQREGAARDISPALLERAEQFRNATTSEGHKAALEGLSKEDKSLVYIAARQPKRLAPPKLVRLQDKQREELQAKKDKLVKQLKVLKTTPKPKEEAAATALSKQLYEVNRDIVFINAQLTANEKSPLDFIKSQTEMALADRKEALGKARSDARKAQIEREIADLTKQLRYIDAQLKTPTLTADQKAKEYKPQKTLYSAKGVRNENTLLGTIADKIKEKLPLTAYEKAVWEKTGTAKTAGIFDLKRAEEAEEKPSTAKQKKESAADREARELREIGEEAAEYDAKFSRGTTENPSTIDSVRTELKKAFSDLGRVQIYDSVDALIKANPQYEGKIPSDARGFVDTAGNKAFLIAENIEQGQALSVLLHEVGTHIGLKNMLGDAQYNSLVNAVKSWEKKADGSIEARVAKAARARVEAAETKPSHVNDELLAYAVEEAVNAGVKPTESKGVLGRWLSQIAALFRRALERFDMAPEKLDAQGLVDLAFGAAQIEMAPKVPQMSRRQFLRGAGAALGGLKLPQLPKEAQIDALEAAWEGSIEAARTWFDAAEAAAKTPALKALIRANNFFDIDKENVATALYNTSEDLYNHMHYLDYGSLATEEEYRYWTRSYLEEKGINAVAELQTALKQIYSNILGELKQKQVPEVGDLFFTYAGEKSGVAPDALRKAKDLQIKGAEMEKIWNETGWFQGPDKKWRYEIDDSKAKFSISDLTNKYAPGIGDKHKTTVGALMDHPELYALYPDIKNIKVTLYNDPNSDALGSFDRTKKEIKLNVGTSYDPELVLLHELQHYIQGEEGFTRGGSTTGEYLEGYTKAILNAVRESYVRQAEENAGETYYADRVKAIDAGIAAAQAAKSKRAAELIAARAEWKKTSSAIEAELESLKNEVKSRQDAILAARDAYFAASDAYLDLLQRRSRPDQSVIDAAKEKSDQAHAALDKASAAEISYADYHKQSDALRDQKRKAFKDWLNVRYAGKVNIEAAVNDAIKSQLPKSSFFGKFARLMISEQAYQNLLGEIEARDVEERRKLTAEERAATRPYASQPQRREEVLFSRAPKYKSAELSAAGEVADKFIASQKPLYQRLRSENAGLSFATNYVDRFAGFEKLAKYMPHLDGTQMMFFLRMYDQRMNFVSQSVGNGALHVVKKTRPDGREERLIESVKGPSLKSVADILAEAKPLVGDGDGVTRLFTLYLSAIRAKDKGLAALNFGEELTQADLDKAVRAVESTPGLEEIFKRARKEYNAYNRNQLNFLVQTGAMPKDVADRLLKNDDYIPWYREVKGHVVLDIGSETPFRIGNLADQPYLHELIGGNKPILDVTVSSVQNTNMLVDMGLRNLAIRDAVFKLVKLKLATISRKQITGTDVVSFRIQPEDAKDTGERWARIDTDSKDVPADLLVKGLEGIPTQLTGVMRLMQMPATLLRKAVVISPLYQAKAIFRDSLAAPILAGADFTPMLGALKEINSATKNVLEQRGITGGQVFTGTSEDLSRILQDIVGGKPGWMKLVGKLEAAGMEADASTRRAQYNSYIKQGLSEMEATLMSLESMNFNKRGASPSIHMINSLIPFFNAQIQSLNVLYKALTGKMPFNDKLRIQQKLLERGFMLAAISAYYAMAMQDDEAYKNARPEQKYGNWFMRLPGVEEPVKLPIPFEIGYIFKALPEAMVNLVMDKHASDDIGKALANIILQTIPGGSSYGLPQAAKPLIEVATGHSFFTQRDILSQHEKMLLPEAQYRENTSELAKSVGKALGVSPIMTEQLINGYFGTMGLALVQAISLGITPSESPAKAVKRLSDMPLIGGAFQPNDAGSIVSSTYDRMLEIKKLKTTFDDMVKRGQKAEAKALLDKRGNEYMAAEAADYYISHIKQYTQSENAVKASNRSETEKRKLLDTIQQQKIKFATAFREAYDKRERQSARP